MALLRLPDELLVLICGPLDCRALLACKLVCQRIRAVIQDHPALQYTIELAASGMRDGPSTSLPVSNRLAMLMDHQAAWANSAWVPLDPPLFSQPWSPDDSILLHAASAGIVASRYDVPEPPQTINITQLPSVLRGVEKRSWTWTCEEDIHNLAVDGSQDLLVLLVNPLVGDMDLKRTIRAVSLSTGRPHPSVHDGSESTQVAKEFSHLMVSGDVVLLTGSHVRSRKIGLWHWKTGEFCMATPQTPPHARRYDFHPVPVYFLDEYHIALLAHCPESASMDVYDIRDCFRRPLASNDDTVDLHVKFRFMLPTPAPGNVITLINFAPKLGPSPSRSSCEQGAFITDSAAGSTCAIIFLLMTPTPSSPVMILWELYFPTHKLLSFAKEYGRDAGTEVVLWEHWGPQLSYFVPAPRSIDLHTYGMTVARFDRDRSSITVLDFHERNSRRCRMPLTANLSTLGGFPKTIESRPPFLVTAIDIPKNEVPSRVTLCEDTLFVHLTRTGPTWWEEVRLFSLQPPASTPDELVPA
ncbi:hypothetical protein FA95DRAFT_1680673 [Auriscalpium vulgare]|uniref:Uncharacterized protein n=1 Tax=Auriscalpium vulgare TaxID=40419 RepID=A0ACB8RLX2_9AGAM|nr:hypothetical protein FA95DRAFT_1680673 [Auriscalpium vulgare]